MPGHYKSLQLGITDRIEVQSSISHKHKKGLTNTTRFPRERDDVLV